MTYILRQNPTGFEFQKIKYEPICIAEEYWRDLTVFSGKSPSLLTNLVPRTTDSID